MSESALTLSIKSMFTRNENNLQAFSFLLKYDTFKHKV